MKWYSTFFENVLIEVNGDYQEPEYETGFKGGFIGSKYEVNGVEISSLLSETVKEQIDEQIASEI